MQGDRAQQRAEQRPHAADDRHQQALDRYCRADRQCAGRDRGNTGRRRRRRGRLKKPDSMIAPILTRNASTPSARAASSLSRTAVSCAPKRELPIQPDREEGGERHAPRSPRRSPPWPGTGNSPRYRLERDEQPDAGAGEPDGVGEDAQHFGEGQRHEREIGAAQAVAERREADEGGDRRSRQPADARARTTD